MSFDASMSRASATRSAGGSAVMLAVRSTGARRAARRSSVAASGGGVGGSAGARAGTSASPSTKKNDSVMGFAMGATLTRILTSPRESGGRSPAEGRRVRGAAPQKSGPSPSLLSPLAPLRGARANSSSAPIVPSNSFSPTRPSAERLEHQRAGVRALAADRERLLDVRARRARARVVVVFDRAQRVAAIDGGPSLTCSMIAAPGEIRSSLRSRPAPSNVAARPSSPASTRPTMPRRGARNVRAWVARGSNDGSSMARSSPPCRPTPSRKRSSPAPLAIAASMRRAPSRNRAPRRPRPASRRRARSARACRPGRRRAARRSTRASRARCRSRGRAAAPCR